MLVVLSQVKMPATPDAQAHPYERAAKITLLF
jgi:hypothetical protein